jgi:hypothetical protein
MDKIGRKGNCSNSHMNDEGESQEQAKRRQQKATGEGGSRRDKVQGIKQWQKH